MISYRKQFFIAAIGGFLSLACSSAIAGSTSFGFGVEGFQDKYKEDDESITGTTNAGSLTGYFSYQMTKRMFVSFDARGSYGTQDFSSPSTGSNPTGNVSGIPQWEFELRGRTGYSFPVWGGEMSPYIGLGFRYVMTQGKSYTTDQGAEDYDTGESQFYIPIGASYFHDFGGGWSVAPQAEADVMFYGTEDSRLTNVVNGFPGGIGACTTSCNGFQFLNTASTDQHWGLGGRAELMVGKAFNGYSLQAGPFVRYWYVPQSEKVTYTNLSGGTNPEYYIPKNTDMQLGVSLRMLF